MKQFNFVEFFYDAVKSLTVEQKGQFLEVMCEYYFNGKKDFPNVSNTVIGAANMAINYNKKNVSVSTETFRDWSNEVRIWCKDSCLIENIKVGLTTAKDIQKKFPHIPFEYLVKIVTWIKDKYDEKFYR